MFKFPIGPDDTFLILAPRGTDLGPFGQIGVLALVLLVPLGLIGWLYRYELRLVAGWQACGLLMLRLSMLGILWLAVALQPHFAAIHVEETPGRVRVAVDLSSSMDIVDADSSRSRRSIVESILSPRDKDLLKRLADRHEVEIVGFHQQSFEMQPAQVLEQLARPNADTVDTNLHLALANVNSPREHPLLGIVLFSDGQHNVGAAPLERADELNRQRVPIFPVVIGSKNPPSDLMILDVQAPTKVFKDATAPIEIRVRAANLPAQELTIEMQMGDKPVKPEHLKVVEHDGKDDVHTIRFQAKMDEVGTHSLRFKATSKQQKEISLANNVASHLLRVAQDKARVLVIDGEARWEYHYLAVALLRDPAIEVERVVFTQPRIGAIKDTELEKSGLAKTKLPEAKERDPLMDYDCILLGDVSPDEIPFVDRRRLEKYVAERGGTLLMIAGKRHLPMAYVGLSDDPFAKLLPITAPTELKKDAGFALRVTNEGKLQPFLQLNPDQPVFAWPELPKHFWGVVGKRRPAATVLLAPVVDNADVPTKAADDTGILVQQNYGFGRVLFLGIDSTWRWRYRVGDTYHHRFWGQLARWEAADKLLPAGNRHVRYGSREPVYAEGDEVDLAARLSATLPPLKEAARVKLHKQNKDGSEETIAVVPLTVHPRQPNALEAKVRELAPGTYRIELDMPQFQKEIAEPNDAKDAIAKGGDLFHILPKQQKELLDLSVNWNLLQSLAERSGGKLYTPDNVEEVVERLARRIERKEYRDEQRPWQDEPTVWWMLAILLGLLTIEWSWRRWLELA